MKTPLQFVIALAVASATCCPVGAQITINRTIGLSDGLVHSTVHALFEDSRGYLWFGTGGGASRWDGSSWVNFQEQDGLPGSRVNGFAEDEKGDIYLATSAGVAVVNEDRITATFSVSDEASGHILAIHRTADGTIYLGTWGGGLAACRNNEVIKRWTSETGLVNDVVMDITENSHGDLVLGTWGGGIQFFDGTNFKQILNKQNGLVNDHIWDLATAAYDTLYAATWGGLSVYADSAFHFELSQPGGQNFDIYAVHKSANNRVYLGTENGVLVRVGAKIVDTVTAENGLANDDIETIHEGKTGVLYFGMGNSGVALYRPGSIFSLNSQTGLGGNAVSAICEMPGGTIYLGMPDHGLAELRDQQKRLLTTTQGLVTNGVTSLASDGKGKLYIGTFGGGVQLLENGRFSKIFDLRSGLRTNRIQHVLVASTGELYVGTWSGGVSIFKGDAFHKNLTANSGLTSDVVNFIYEDREGTLYFCDGSVSRYRDGHFLPPLTSLDGLPLSSITAIYQDRAGRLYFASWGAGLAILNGSEVEIVTAETGLSSNIIYAIAEDDSGSIYLNTAKGVTILNRTGENSQILTLNSLDGLASDSGTRALLHDSQNRIWIGTSGGVSCFAPAALQPNPYPPRVHFTKITLFDEQLPVWAGSRQFNYAQNFFRFDFVGINLPAPEKVMYKFRLSGVDKDWVTSADHSTQYTSLNHGDYTFEVMARNESGLWSETKELNFEILPPVWKTSWFRIAIIALTCALALLLYKLRVNRLFEIANLRTRIASDLHDDIGATLTHIALGAEKIQTTGDFQKVKEYAQKIAALSREVTYTFSDIVWSIDARNDTWDELIVRMKEFAHQTLAPKEIAFHFEIHGLAQDKAVSVDLRQNIYLIFKEAINNVAKHACAGSVEISLHNGQNFKMRIRDDGRGPVATKNATGTGLRNMAMRAERIGGSLLVASESGFDITLTAPGI